LSLQISFSSLLVCLALKAHALAICRGVPAFLELSAITEMRIAQHPNRKSTGFCVGHSPHCTVPQPPHVDSVQLCPSFLGAGMLTLSASLVHKIPAPQQITNRSARPPTGPFKRSLDASRMAHSSRHLVSATARRY